MILLGDLLADLLGVILKDLIDDTSLELDNDFVGSFGDILGDIFNSSKSDNKLASLLEFSLCKLSILGENFKPDKSSFMGSII